MKFMIMIKATKDSEAGVMPTEELIADMMNYNEDLVNAGIMLGGDGLQPSSKGARAKFSNGTWTFTDGPFPETKELVAGYWLWQCKSKEEAFEWINRMPNPMPDTESEVEIRPLYEADDFGEEFTPELREKWERVNAKTEKN